MIVTLSIMIYVNVHKSNPLRLKKFIFTLAIELRTIITLEYVSFHK